MNRTIHVDVFDPASVNAAVNELREYAVWIRRKANELAQRLADIGVVNVSLGYARAIYTGENDITVTVEEQGEGRYAIIASGNALLFIEFGAGVTYGYGHPDPVVGETVMGPGTYPYGKGHWDDPDGWYLPGYEHIHTYGNPPSMTMYLTAKELRDRLQDIAQEVFSHD